MKRYVIQRKDGSYWASYHTASSWSKNLQKAYVYDTAEVALEGQVDCKAVRVHLTRNKP